MNFFLGYGLLVIFKQTDNRICQVSVHTVEETTKSQEPNEVVWNNNWTK